MKHRSCIAIGIVLALGTSSCDDNTRSQSTPTSKNGRSVTRSVPTGLIRTAALSSASSCDDLLRELKSFALGQVGPFGLGQGSRYGTLAYTDGVTSKAAEGTASRSPSAATSSAAPPSGGGDASYSQTNNQVAGVDEPDSVKTDGTTMWVVRDSTLFTIALGDIPSIAAQRTFESTPQLLRAGNSLVALTPKYEPQPELDQKMAAGMSYPYMRSSSTLVELLDPATLETQDELIIDGDIQGARSLGESLRLVVSESGPQLGFQAPKDSNNLESLKEADATNRAVIEKSNLKDWIPDSWLSGDREQACRAFGVPAEFSGFSLVGVAGISIDATDLKLKSMAGLIADPGTVYANGNTLYVATARYIPTDVSQDLMPRIVDNQSTEVHRFNISSVDSTKYEASGSVKGHLLNQYAMDEYKDVLRIATTTERWSTDGNGQNASESRVTTMKREGKELLGAGEVTGLGKGETIQSVRFVEDRGFVVTFRQTDPLYVIDLTDPAAPKVTGELKVTGFSEYLHPVGDHRLLGIGPEADESGQITGYQASLFDVNDPSAPKQLSRLELTQGRSSQSLQYDPHAFLYWAKTGLAVVP
ncbi:MAG: beta-propeller domain-containing protein, partial [Acidimicrobiia bacterium]